MLQKVVKECDANGDGVVSVQEFLDHFVKIPALNRPINKIMLKMKYQNGKNLGTREND